MASRRDGVHATGQTTGRLPAQERPESRASSPVNLIVVLPCPS